MKKDKQTRLDAVKDCAKIVVNLCADFANEKEEEAPDRRLFRLYAAYVVAVDTVTQGIKSSSGEFMEKMNKNREELEDSRGKNL